MASKPRHQISWAYKNYFLHIGNKWYYGRDGHLVIARGSSETDPNLSYTQDWRRLTGVTHDDGSVLESAQFNKTTTGYFQPAYIRCESPMAGAAILDGRDGVAGIEIHAGMTRARKSYFFLHDQKAIVMMGSHIQGRGPTESIVHTFPVDDGPVRILMDGKPVELAEGAPTRVATPCWMHGPGGGYWFPEKGVVTLIAETRKPDFEDHGNPPPDQQPKVPVQKFISILFDHGKDPTNAGYACVLFPLAAAADMPMLAQSIASHWTFDRNDVGHLLRSGELTMAAFFQPGSLAGYGADRTCFVALRQTNQGVRVATYEPSWKDVTLQLHLPFPATGPALPDNCRLENDILSIKSKAAQPAEYRLVLGSMKQ
jgi:hypothetical protein